MVNIKNVFANSQKIKEKEKCQLLDVKFAIAWDVTPKLVHKVNQVQVEVHLDQVQALANIWIHKNLT